MAADSIDDTDDGVACSLHLGSREAWPLVGSFTASAVELLGLSAVDGSRLGALVQEVVGCVLVDAFEPGEPVDVDVRVRRTPGAVTICVDDRGAVSSFSVGDYPPTVADLVRLGFADDLTVRTQGRLGNRTEITKNLPYAPIEAEAAFAGADDDEIGDSASEQITVRAMGPDDVLGVARLFYRTYGNTAYHASIVYEPGRLAEFVRSGRHLATVAVTGRGRIVGHLASEVDEPGATTGRIGLLAIDPAYRGTKLSAELVPPHVARLLELGFVGQYAEAVTLHERSQRAALAAGFQEVGVMLAGQQPTMEFRDFDANDDHRRSLMIMFSALGQIPARTVHMPAGYADVARRIYGRCTLDRTLAPSSLRESFELAPATALSLRLLHEASVAFIRVADFGHDFDDVLQAQVEQLRMNHFDVIQLYLPLSNPGTGQFGGGLHELGMSFAGIYPEYDEGDFLVLQCLNNVDIDPRAITVASDFGSELVDFVVADRASARQRDMQRARSRTRMARVLEALG